MRRQFLHSPGSVSMTDDERLLGTSFVWPAVPPDELNKLAEAMIFASDAGFGSDDSYKHLLFGVSNRNDQLTPDAQLLDEWLRDLGAACCNKDPVIRRVLAPADCAVEPLDRRVITSESPNVSLRVSRKLTYTFDGKYASGDSRKHRRLVPRSRADLEHGRILVGFEKLSHARDHVRLRNGLHIANGQRVITVSLCLQRIGHEKVTWNLAHRFEHAFVLNSAASKQLNHTRAMWLI